MGLSLGVLSQSRMASPPGGLVVLTRLAGSHMIHLNKRDEAGIRMHQSITDDEIG